MEASIRRAQGDADISSARALFLEYAQWLKVDLCFQGFDQELATLPGAYAPPLGCLLLAAAPQKAAAGKRGAPGSSASSAKIWSCSETKAEHTVLSAFGCIALRPLDARPHCGSSQSQSAASATSGSLIGEVKRLYVQPARRGQGWGQRLAQAAIAEASAMGYTDLKLDTLGWMTEARALYALLGFRECEPYYDNPLHDVVYMTLAL